jgi:hypothetical protein
MDGGLGRGVVGVKLPASVRAHLGPALLVALALTVLLVGIWSQPALPGADTWGHLFKAEYLAGQMHQSGIGAYFSTAWMPAWYMGDPFRTYYPPLTTLILAPLVYLTGNSLTAFALFATGALLAMAALTYGFLFRAWGPWPAAFGTTLVLWAPYQMRTLLFEGNLPRVLALIGLPAIAWLTERLLTTTTRRLPIVVLLGLAWCWTILAHPQQAAIFAVGLLIYIMARFLLDTGLSLRGGGLWLVGLGLGAVLSAAWVLPAYSHAELSDVPFLPLEKVGLFSTPLSAILPAPDMSAGRVILGVGTLAIAVLAAAARPEGRRTAWLVSGMATAWLALGPAGVLFNLLPLHNQLLPERFLNFSAFVFPVAAAGILPIRRRAQILRVGLVAAIALVDIYPGFSLLSPRPYPVEAAGLSTIGDRTSPYAGRTLLLTYPEPTATEVYFAGQGSDLVNGWALENTPHNVALRRLLSAPTWSPDYFNHLVTIWDVRQIVLRGNQPEAQAARDALLMAGWNLASLRGTYELWQDPAPPAPVQAIPAARILALGQSLPPFLMDFPYAEESQVQRLSNVAASQLASYPALALYQFEDSEAGMIAADASLRDYLSRGGRVVTDLSGMEALIGRTSDLLGVRVLRLSFQDHITLRWKDPAPGLPTTLPLERIAPEGWSGATYDGLDGVLAEAQYNDQWYPILGYKDVGKGRAWFVGLNLLYYAQTAGLPEVASDVVERALQGVDINRSVGFEPLPSDGWHATGRGLSFGVVAPAGGADALIAYTYTPRWNVTLDGKTVPFADYEGLLRVAVPAGAHRIAVDYHPYGTPSPAMGLVVTLFGAVLAGAAIAWDRWFKGPEVLAVRKPASPLAPAPTYVPCANCGFRLSEAGPPTAITYPFQVVHCAICGLSMDDEGYQAGKELSPEERSERLDTWLAQYSYDPSIVHNKWGFEVDAFFVEAVETTPAGTNVSEVGSHAESHPDR